ncbi:MAG: DUF3524 domain-containing protein [Fibrobacterales bacterium]
MKILLVEAFYSGSHKAWADQFKEHSSHDIELITLEGKFWKWRMYGACVTLAERVAQLKELPDVILTTDMLDVAAFSALLRHTLPSHIPIVTYFHENQLAYPWQPDSEDKQEGRDVHFGMMNYTTMLASDYVLFNSAYNRSSFFDELGKLLNKMPDYKHTDTLKKQYTKTSVLPLGISFTAESQSIGVAQHASKESGPMILWNHRLDHDKNPKDFFNALIELKRAEIPFQLVFLGEQTNTQKKNYGSYLNELESHTLFSGYATRDEYHSFMHNAHILPVTSIHDFFGISIAEAVHAGVRPLLPKRLSYVELYKPDENPELFYDTYDDLVIKLKELCASFQKGTWEKGDYRKLVASYDWSTMIGVYDELFSDILDKKTLNL